MASFTSAKMAGAKKFFKKRSKRIPTKLRVKAEKKLREHNRKARAEKRKNPGKYNKRKKDPGVPSDCPFREEVLREVEEMRRRKEDEKEERRKRMKALKEAEKNGSAMPVCPKVDSKAGDDFSFEELLEEAPTPADDWEKVLKENKILLHVIDARRPADTIVEDISDAVSEHKGHKRLIYVLSKADLVPRDNLKAWLSFIRKTGEPAIAFRSSIVVQRSSGGVEQRSRAAGIDSLMFLLQSFCNKNSSSSQDIRVGVIGVRGVGKRSLIETLKKSKVFCSEKRIKLSEVPGEVIPEDEDEDNAFDKAQSFVERCDARFLQLKYDVPSFETAAEFLALVKAAATLSNDKKRSKGGTKDLEVAAVNFMKDVDGSAFKFFSEVPNDDEEDVDDDNGEEDKGGKSGDIFHLEKIEMIEKGDLELLPKNSDSEIMKLLGDERDGDDGNSGDETIEGDSEDVDYKIGAAERQASEKVDKVGEKRKDNGKEKVTPRKKTKK